MTIVKQIGKRVHSFTYNVSVVHYRGLLLCARHVIDCERVSDGTSLVGLIFAAFWTDETPDIFIV